MADMRLEFLKTAWCDLDRIADFYWDKVGAVSAEKIMDQIMDMIKVLSNHPYAGPLHPDVELARREYRKLSLTKTYVAIYKVEGDTVYIYRIVNGVTDYPKLLR